jgi:hypothetical protein
VLVGALSAPVAGADPDNHGTIEVGYQIGCGIDMSTSNGVTLTGTVGLTPSIGVIGTDIVSPLPEGIVPGLGANTGGGVSVGLKPGIINVVPVTKKEYEGPDPLDEDVRRDPGLLRRDQDRPSGLWSLSGGRRG